MCSVASCAAAASLRRLPGSSLTSVATCWASMAVLQTANLLNNIFGCPLLVLKGSYHYWTYVYLLQGTNKQMEAKVWTFLAAQEVRCTGRAEEQFGGHVFGQSSQKSEVYRMNLAPKPDYFSAQVAWSFVVFPAFSRPQAEQVDSMSPRIQRGHWIGTGTPARNQQGDAPKETTNIAKPKGGRSRGSQKQAQEELPARVQNPR